MSYTFVDGKIVFPDGQLISRKDLMDEKQDVRILTTGVSVFKIGDKTFQSDGHKQTSVSPVLKDRLDSILFKKGVLLQAIQDRKDGRNPK